MIFKNTQFTDGNGNVSEKLTWAFKDIKDVIGNTKGTKKLAADNTFNVAMDKARLEFDAFNQSVERNISTGMGYAEAMMVARNEINGASDSLQKCCMGLEDVYKVQGDSTSRQEALNKTWSEYTAEQRKAYDASEKNKKGFKGLTTSTKAMLGNIGATMAIAGIFQVMSIGWEKLNDTFKITPEKRVEAMETAVKKYNDVISETGEKTKTLKSLRTEFNTLAKGVDDNGKNIGLSADQYDRYNAIVAQITEINPELVQGYTAEGNAIVNRNNAIQEGIALQKEYADEAARAYTTNSTGNDIIRGSKVNMSEAEKKMQGISSKLATQFKDILVKGTTLSSSMDENGHYGINGTTIAESKTINKLLGEQINLENASATNLQNIASQREGILKAIRESGQYSDKEYESIKNNLIELKAYSDEYEQATKPVVDWLNAYVNLPDEITGKSIGDTIPDALKNSYQEGLREIAASGKDSVAMKGMAANLADTISENYSKNVDNLRDIYDKAEQAKEKFADSNKTKSDIKTTNKVLREQADALDTLAIKYKDTDAALSAFYQNEANSLRNFVQEITESLVNAFNPYQEAFEEAANIGSTFEEWRKGITDYSDGIKSFGQMFESVLTEAETGGNGSMAFWKAAELSLGSKNLREFGYDVASAKTKMTELQSAMTDGATATDYFWTELANNAGEINKVLGEGSVWTNENGINFNIDSNEWAMVADILGIAEDSMMALLNAAQQYSNIDLSNTNAVRQALGAQDTTKTKNGIMYALAEPLERAAVQSLGSVEAAQRRIQELNQEEDIQLIDITTLKDNVNYTKEQLQAQTDVFEKYKQQAKDSADIFSQLGFGQKNNEGFVFNKDDIADVSSAMLQMGGTAEDLFAVLKSWRDDDSINLGELFEGMEDNDLKKFSQDTYAAYQEQMADVDPTTELTGATNALTSAINKLIAAMGVIPDIEIDDNLDEVNQKIEKFKNAGDGDDKNALQKDIENSIKSTADNLDTLQIAYDNMAKGAEKSALGKQIAAANEELETYKRILKDIKDDGEINDSIAPKSKNTLEALKNEYAKAEQWAKKGSISEKALTQIKDGTLKSAFGNVDMDKRVIIEWSSALKRQYKDELSSWGEEGYDPEIGGIDTVFGASKGFMIDGQEVEIAFTPIINEDDGSFKFLGQQTVQNYIQSVIDAASQDGKISVDEILQIDQQGLEVAKYNAAGEVVGKEFVHGLIAAVGDDGEFSAAEIGALMHFAGDDGAIGLALEDVDSRAKDYKESLKGIKDEGDIKTSIKLDDSDAQARIDKFAETLGMTPEEVETMLRAFVEGDDIEQYVEMLDIAPEEKEVVLKAIAAYSEGDIQGYISMLASLPPEVQTLVSALTSGAISNLQIVDGKITAVDGMTANPTVNVTDNASGVLSGIQAMLNGISNGASAVVSVAKQVFTKKGSKAGETERGTANRRKQSYFPSLEKGGKVGPTGHGGLTLVGEVGAELVRLPDEATSFLVGQYGPEMINLPANAVVYPADETRRIIGDTLPPGRLRFGSMARGNNYQPGSSGSSWGGGKSSGSSSGSGSKSSKSNEESQYEKNKKALDHELKMGYITQATYYSKLDALQKKYKSELAKDIDDQRAALEDLRDAWIDAFEEAKKSLNHQLEMGQLSEAQYYDKLKALGDQYYKNRKGYTNEWKEHLEELKDARKDAYDAQLEDLDKALEKETITIEKYYEKVKELQNKYLAGPEMKKDLKDAAEDMYDALKDALDEMYDDVQQQIDDNDIFNLWVDGGDTAVDMLQDFRDQIAKDGRKYFETEKAWKEYLLELDRDIAEAEKDQAEERQDQLNNILDLTEALLKQEAEDYKDALSDQVDAYRDLIDAKKEALRLSEKELSYQEKMSDYAKDISKLQSEIELLARDDSRAAAAKRAEKEEELAELLQEQQKTQREETLDRTEDSLDKQAELFEELINKQIELVDNWLDNKSAVLETVQQTIEQRETNDLLNRLIAYNGEHGDAMLSTVNKAWKDLDMLIGEYGSDVETIVEVLQKGIDVNIKGGIIDKGQTDYAETQQKTLNKPVTVHHAGLATGFTGDGADKKQHEVYRLLTDDELVFNRDDQMRIAGQLQTLDTIKTTFAKLSKGIETPASPTPRNIELTVNAPITIKGNASAETVKEIKKAIDDASDKSIDKLAEALRINGVRGRVASNVRKN